MGGYGFLPFLLGLSFTRLLTYSQVHHHLIHLNSLYISPPNAEVQNFLAETLDDLLVKGAFQRKQSLRVWEGQRDSDDLGTGECLFQSRVFRLEGSFLRLEPLDHFQE